jgi:hypothetical protein
MTAAELLANGIYRPGYTARLAGADYDTLDSSLDKALGKAFVSLVRAVAGHDIAAAAGPDGLPDIPTFKCIQLTVRSELIPPNMGPILATRLYSGMLNADLPEARLVPRAVANTLAGTTHYWVRTDQLPPDDVANLRLICVRLAPIATGLRPDAPVEDSHVAVMPVLVVPTLMGRVVRWAVWALTARLRANNSHELCYEPVGSHTAMRVTAQDLFQTDKGCAALMCILDDVLERLMRGEAHKTIVLHVGSSSPPLPLRRPGSPGGVGARGAPTPLSTCCSPLTARRRARR